MSDFGQSYGIDPSDNAVLYSDDKRMVVRFYRAMKRDNYNSNMLQRLVEHPVDMVEIKRFGERDTMVRVVEESDKRRWPGFWRAYQNGREQVVEGLSLEILFPANPEIITDLKSRNIHTIEALAEIPDTVNFPFAGDFKSRAKKFLDAQKDGQKFLEMDRRLATSAKENAELQAQLQKLALQVEAMQQGVPARRGPGRPRKNAAIEDAALDDDDLDAELDPPSN